MSAESVNNALILVLGLVENILTRDIEGIHIMVYYV